MQASLHNTAPLRQRVAVIGGGWAGMAAAVELVQRGHEVHVWEMARHWGGRARAMPVTDASGHTFTLDNGQHILIGAYTECLRLMRTVGIAPERALLRLPLDLRDAQGMGLQLPDLPPPWNALAGIARAKGWSWKDKCALLAHATRWKAAQFQCTADATVAQLCAGLPRALLRDFIDPLCISALNLPAEQASGQVFLRVLRDALFAGTGGSDLLIPRVDLGTLFPSTAAAWLMQHGAQLHLGQRVQQLSPLWPSAPSSRLRWAVDAEAFDAVVLATSSTEAARLAMQGAAQLPHAAAQAQGQQWAAVAHALPHTAITTVYARQTGPVRALPAPMVALRSSAHAPAQFAFDRGQLEGSKGLLALVISASDTLADMDRARIEQAALAQAQEQLQLPGLELLRTVVEKRATFACTPHIHRPAQAVAPQLWACGDYIDGPYPATLEGAVRSGVQAAHQLKLLSCSNEHA